jgi:DNA primase
MPKPESIINSQIYPNLSHKIIFGDLPGFKSSGKPGAFVARCPNPEHKDKTPSFLMPPGKPYGFCKSCGYKPNWFYYIKKRDNLTDAETFKKLAKMAGVELKSNISPEEWKNIKKARDKKEVRNEIYKEARDYFKHLLKSHPEAAKARSYLKDRNINPSDYNQFDLGYYPTRAEVEQYLLSKNFRSDEIITSGIIKDEYFERSHNLVFFYQNLSGDYEWIKGRRLDQIKKAKTLPQKGFPAARALYNIYSARPEIQKKKWALVVEGEIDCKRVEKIGIKNVVSTSSANLSTDQLELLKQAGCERVIINFDGDPPGREGTIRALKEMKGLGLIGYAFVVPDDPDSFILEHGEKYLSHLKKAERDFIFVLKHIVRQYDLSFSVKKEACFDEVMKAMELFTIKSLYEKDLFSHYISQIFGLREKI